MVVEVQKQQPQPLQLHVTGDFTAEGGGHNYRVSSAALISTTYIIRRQGLFSPLRLEKAAQFTGNIYYSKTEKKELTILKGEKTMSKRNAEALDLKLNFSPPRMNHPLVESPSRSLSVSPTSPPSSCISSELIQQDEYLRYSTSPEATSMMLVGCPRCLMYVMLAEEDPRCPKCKSSVLLDVIHDNNTTTATSRKTKMC